MRRHVHLILTALTLALAVFAGACSSKPFLKVQYQLPSTSRALEGKEVSLAVTDVRKNDTFLSKNAKKSLKDFKGTFSLVVMREDGSGNLVGDGYIFGRRIHHIARDSDLGRLTAQAPGEPSIAHEETDLLVPCRLFQESVRAVRPEK